MVTLFDKDNSPIRTFQHVREFTRSHVAFNNNGYVGKVYADIDAGEYFDDPDNPLPPEPEPTPTPDASEAFRAGGDAMLNIIKGGGENV